MDVAVEGTMGLLIGKLGDLLTGEYKLLEEANDHIKFLKAELDSIHVLLKKMADAEEEPDEQTKCWVDEVRELSYDIEDNADDFVLHFKQESNDNPQHGFRGFFDRYMNLLSHFSSKEMFNHKETMKEFQGLKRRLVEASERRMRYKLDDSIPKTDNTAIDLRLQALYVEPAGLVGIDRPKEEIIQVMMDEQDVSAQKLMVLSIVGFGGLGKTTLANQIYRQLEVQFEHRAFVSVSQKPNIRKILRNILSQLGYSAQKETNMAIWDEDELIRTLQEFLKNKRYFIVIDDIWDEIIWNIIRCALPEYIKGSRVITTTQIDTVALCCSNHCGYIYKMNTLSNQESRMLFFKRIFGSEDACPAFLKEVSGKILKRCGGLPLAIITISSLLASQRNKLKEQWEHVLDSLGSNLEGHPTLEGMREILSLSYKNLPHHLKGCMLYIGIYPEDHTIEKNDLVRQWVAQGFIRKVHGRDPEDVAAGYFNELVNRSIIEPVAINPNDEVFSCRIHDMILDLIIHKCREENFVVAIDELQATVGLHDKVRRLSLNLDGSIDGTILGAIRLSQVRALARFGTSTYTPCLLEFKFLRVLTLEFPSGNHEQVKLDLTEICHLFQLRYLKIDAHREIFLPRKIGGLQLLETLEIIISSSIYKVEVPSDVVHLRRLLHLILPMGTSLPSGIGNMKSLRTLHDFNLGNSSVDCIRDLGDLTNLKDLSISSLGVREMDDIETRHRTVVLRCSLEKLCNLKYLWVYPFPHCGCCDALSSLSAPPRLLQRLRIRQCLLPRMPRWIGELHNLYDLELMVKEASDEDVKILGQLPSLIRFWLHIIGTPNEHIVIRGTGCPVLKHFRFSSTWPWRDGGWMEIQSRRPLAGTHISATIARTGIPPSSAEEAAVHGRCVHKD